MTEWGGYVFVFCLLSISTILMFLTVFAFSEPTAFVKWATPLDWISRRFFKSSYECNVVLASGAAILSFLSLVTVSFCLGGWFVTATFSLLNSPYSGLVFP